MNPNPVSHSLTITVGDYRISAPPAHLRLAAWQLRSQAKLSGGRSFIEVSVVGVGVFRGDPATLIELADLIEQRVQSDRPMNGEQVDGGTSIPQPDDKQPSDPDADPSSTLQHYVGAIFHWDTVRARWIPSGLKTELEAHHILSAAALYIDHETLALPPHQCLALRWGNSDWSCYLDNNQIAEILRICRMDHSSTDPEETKRMPHPQANVVS